MRPNCGCDRDITAFNFRAICAQPLELFPAYLIPIDQLQFFALPMPEWEAGREAE